MITPAEPRSLPSSFPPTFNSVQMLSSRNGAGGKTWTKSRFVLLHFILTCMRAHMVCIVRRARRLIDRLALNGLPQPQFRERLLTRPSSSSAVYLMPCTGPSATPELVAITLGSSLEPHWGAARNVLLPCALLKARFASSQCCSWLRSAPRESRFWSCAAAQVGLPSFAIFHRSRS